MEPRHASQRLLAVTRSRAKLLEYSIPTKHHFELSDDPARLLLLAVGILGDEAAAGAVEQHEPAPSLPTRFSAYFFDAYLRSGLGEIADDYALLLASASYYLCDLAGSSLVLAQELSAEALDLGGAGIDRLLLALLLADPKSLQGIQGYFAEEARDVMRHFTEFFAQGASHAELQNAISYLRQTIYRTGTARQVLLGDLACAVTQRRLTNSTWVCLPRYTGVPRDDWASAFRKRSFIRELWPAQHRLGEAGVLAGMSAVVQMPTSAGKSRATELLIRSAFLAKRAALAVVVAPFRSLCHEIRHTLQRAFAGEDVVIDEFTDVMQMDISGDLAQQRGVVVVTPEKLLYVLRHNPDLAKSVGVLVLDEGHQFDSGTRGVTYELLITSLKRLIPEDAQKVLISAVISNASAVNEWLNGERGKTLEGTGLTPTYRTVAFSSWRDLRGRLEFVAPENPDNREFFVPRVLEQRKLNRRRRERTDKLFPEKDNGGDVALYLSLKLVKNGGVAVFCAQKATAANLAARIVDVFGRGVDGGSVLPSPSDGSNQAEVAKLADLYRQNLGSDTAAQAAELGVFTHHANTPHGIRQALEFALREGLVRLVVCTSTLAQGVNLPIRYLLVAGTQQGTDRISVRDFQNLIGRAGRAGKHTEGSVIFTNPGLYDSKDWRWTATKALLNPSLSEPCASSILSVLKPLERDDRRHLGSTEDPLLFLRLYAENYDEFQRLPEKLASRNSGCSAKKLRMQLDWRERMLASIESFLMAHWADAEGGFDSEAAVSLARDTLAYHLGNEQQKYQLVELFQLLARSVEHHVAEADRPVYGKSLYGVRNSITVSQWLDKEIGTLAQARSQAELLSVLWPLFLRLTTHKDIKRCSVNAAMAELALGWIAGTPYHVLLARLERNRAKIVTAKQRRGYKVGHLVDICENGLAFEGTLLVSAIVELLLVRGENFEPLVESLKSFQKSIRYGLPPGSAVILYEQGLGDRVVAQRAGSLVSADAKSKEDVLGEVREREQDLRAVLERFPAYFESRLRRML